MIKMVFKPYPNLFIPKSHNPSMTKKTFYVTTAIDYVNSAPHVGHAYQKIAADVLARWNKLLGKDVFFATGTDEYGKKVAQTAKSLNKSPKEFTDEVAQKFIDAWKLLNINYNRFIRTTDKDHEKTVLEFVKKINENGDIYKGKYSGYYCVGCETYYTEKDILDKICPIHKKPLERVDEESYFFKLSKYQKYLLNLYKKNPNFVLPDGRRNAIINRVKEGLQDLSITRTTFDWGIPFPLEKGHVIYVWFDALINYYSAINDKNKIKFWPADVHLLGPDNGWFHAVIWPAMLKAAGIEIPKKVFIHGFLTLNGQKISKSLGNTISPTELVQKYGCDTTRYFSLRQYPFGQDGDFSETALIDRHNNELANKLGNLISRVSALAEKYEIKKTPIKTLDTKILQRKVNEHMENLEFDKALNEIFSFIDKCNTFIQDEKPWEVRSPQGVGEERESSSKSESNSKKVLYELSNAIKDFSILLSPFIPETSEKIAKTFNFSISIKSLQTPLKPSKIKKAEILFKKIDVPITTSQVQPNNKDKSLSHKSPSKVDVTANNSAPANNKVNKSPIPGVINMSQIKYDDFAKVELKVATIKKVEDIEGADKLYKLEIDLGSEKRTICAGIKQHYKKEELAGKQIIVVTNLEPRKMKGIESNGMLLAASNDSHDKVVIISPDKKVDAGLKIG
jgi:methionyl-tRNA synthetase